MIQTVQELGITGMTALGPALTLCAAMVADCPYSEIVLCTDGMANVGLGSVERDPHGCAHIYDKVRRCFSFVHCLSASHIQGKILGYTQWRHSFGKYIAALWSATCSQRHGFFTLAGSDLIFCAIFLQIGEYAMGNKTKVSVIGLEGADMAMQVSCSQH